MEATSWLSSAAQLSDCADEPLPQPVRGMSSASIGSGDGDGCRREADAAPYHRQNLSLGALEAAISHKKGDETVDKWESDDGAITPPLNIPRRRSFEQGTDV